MEGIDEFSGREFEWAVGTVLANNYDEDDLNKKTDLKPLARAMTEEAWEFITHFFDEAGLARPDQVQLTNAVAARLKDIKAERYSFPEDCE